MKLLDRLSGRVGDETEEHEINPVYDTAKNCLANLARAGCKEAQRLNDVLQFAENTQARSAIDKGVALFQETRYRFVNEQIRQSGYSNILDIGCGYSPRGLLFAEQGYHYIGADLPAAVREIEPAVRKCVSPDASANLTYIGLDATDPQALLQAAESLEGPVCVVTEGVMMYFATYELNEYLKGISGVLQARGGCAVTPDFCMNRLLKLSTAAASHKVMGSLLQVGAEKVVKDYIISSNDEMDPSVWYADESDEKPYAYFTAKGFHIDRVPVCGPETNLVTLSYLDRGRAEKFLEACRQTFGWKLTVGDR